MWGGQLAYHHRLDDRRNAWVALSRGFKAGGFNIGASVPADRAEFEPEYLWSLEAGIKGAWDDGRLVADVSLFALRREQQQVATSFQLDPQDPLTFIYLTDNAARGRAYGLEAGLRWQPVDRWMLSASLSLADTEYLGYTYGERDLDGREWAHAPTWKYSMSAAWNHPRGWFARADVAGQDAFYFDASHDERSNPYSLVNLAGGFRAEQWSVQLWLHNALDQCYPVRGFYFGNEPPDFPAQLYVRLGDPRQAGLTATFSF
jgi:outer membrane receptor protein involved in Fe transport